MSRGLCLLIGAGSLVCMTPACDAKPSDSPRYGGGAFAARPDARGSSIASYLVPPFVCTKVGCRSGVTIVVHVAVPPAVLAQTGSFHACDRGECWDGTFAEPTGNSVPPCTTPARGSDALCQVAAEEGGSTVILRLTGERASRAGAAGLADGDVVSLRVDAGGTTWIDASRAIDYVDRYPNGRWCGGHCRTAVIEMTSEVPAKP